jgi:hypothetical protein
MHMHAADQLLSRKRGVRVAVQLAAGDDMNFLTARGQIKREVA